MTKAAVSVPAVETGVRISGRRRLLAGFARDSTSVMGAVLVALFVLAAIFAPVLAAHDPNTADVVNKFSPPSRDHLLGTDHLGRDIFGRLLFGARLSIGATVVTALGITIVGIVLGMLAGYVGGVVDSAISRTIDILLGFPHLLLVLALIALLGPGLRNIMLAYVVEAWAGYARIVRGAVLAEREKPYVEAARALGASGSRILRRHVLPNIVAPIVVYTTLDLGVILLGISALSFLGLGVQPPTPEWGAMLAEATSYLAVAPHAMFFPGAAIFLTVLGFNLLGDGLRDVLDPR
ncbi:MAG: ABC transporter permease, partial [Actinomycetota bacterium]|nr:ABC transporter permease [Actinomycetota bacterium]